MKSTIANAALFQIVWIACVGGGGAGLWWLGPLAVCAFCLWQLPVSRSRQSDLLLLVVAAPIGLVVESSLIASGLLRYPSPGPLGPGLAPIWIVALWVGFVLTLNHSLKWLKGKPVLSAAVGGIAGPFSYWIGASTWRAAEFTAPTPTVLGVLMVVWAVATPTLAWLADRFDSRRVGEPSSITVLDKGGSLPPAV